MSNHGHPSNFDDKTGRRFGSLTAVKYLGDSKWECLCDCGNTAIVSAGKLSSGKTKSCGCRKYRRIDRTGKRYGRLLVISDNGDGKWLCRCDCGNTVSVSGSSLGSGDTKSCGCLRRDRQRKAVVTHGQYQTRLYRLWANMIARCETESRREYKNYGGRGISVCEEWRNDFTSFRDWAVSNGYDPKLPTDKCMLDRIDNDGNYCPSNCRWVTRSEQNRNKRGLEKPRTARPVLQLDEYGNVVARFRSMTMAGNAIGIPPSCIRQVCIGDSKSTHGTYWRFAKPDADEERLVRVPAQEGEEGVDAHG